MKLLALLFLIFSCKTKSSDVQVFMTEPYPEKLSEWNLFVGKLSELKPNKRVIPYTLNSPLFSDYTNKTRFIWMPEGKSANFKKDDVFDFPIGTIFSKTFSFDDIHSNFSEPSKKQNLIETRLLIHTNSGWVALPYIWDEEMKDAKLEITGGRKQFERIDKISNKKEFIDFRVPNTNQCSGCHSSDKQITPIGPKARNLDSVLKYDDGEENQLEHWSKIGYLKDYNSNVKIESMVAISSKGNLNNMARSYLDINCAHCHNPKGPANNTGLYLNFTETDPIKLGICKTPVAAGKGAGNLKYDIYPGKPSESILYFRMNSIEPDIMMPELGKSSLHKEGLLLIKKWIESEKGNCL
jgi:uncharacterized repeat protein (TIGR03806 family)